MKILFFIGNGFDLNLDLKTSFESFNIKYKEAPSKSLVVNNLKKNISDNIKNWADLEIEIGKYTEHINSQTEFDEIYEDIVEHLSIYLDNQEKSLDYSKANRERFFSDLTKPEKYLFPTDKRIIDDFKKNYIGSHWHINIITLNYTRTIEKIVSEKIEDINIGGHIGKNVVYLQSIEHIHGYLDTRMIIGVNDLTQIKNKKFHGNDDICSALIKRNHNKAAKQFVHERCEALVREANLICIFGSSIGDTDMTWWENIGRRLKAGSRLIYFTQGDKINEMFQHKISRKEKELRDFFLKKTGLTDEEKKEIENNILIAYNTDIFSNLFPEK